MKRKEFIKEIRVLDVVSLSARESELAEELMRLRFKKASRQLESPHRIGQVRRSLARVSTEISKRRAGEGASAAK